MKFLRRLSAHSCTSARKHKSVAFNEVMNQYYDDNVFDDSSSHSGEEETNETTPAPQHQYHQDRWYTSEDMKRFRQETARHAKALRLADAQHLHNNNTSLSFTTVLTRAYQQTANGEAATSSRRLRKMEEDVAALYQMEDYFYSLNGMERQVIASLAQETHDARIKMIEAIYNVPFDRLGRPKKKTMNPNLVAEELRSACQEISRTSRELAHVIAVGSNSILSKNATRSQTKSKKQRRRRTIG